jgi:hypothetical protein
MHGEETILKMCALMGGILEWIIMEENEMALIGFIWLRMGTSGWIW